MVADWRKAFSTLQHCQLYMKKRGSKDLDLLAVSSMPASQVCRHPYSVVWGPIPLLTWLFPFIGHIGVCCSNGVIYDFAGPYTVNEDRFLVGKPTRYWQLEPRSATTMDTPTTSGAAVDVESTYPSWAAQASLSALADAWDDHLSTAADTYKCLWYNLFTENCHAFVVHFLNSISYAGHTKWNMVRLAVHMFLRAHYTSWAGFLWTWLPFCLLMPAGVVYGGWKFVAVYCTIAASLVLWFLLFTFCIWKPKALIPARMRAAF